MRRSKLLTFLLGVVLILGLFSGCGSGGGSAVYSEGIKTDGFSMSNGISSIELAESGYNIEAPSSAVTFSSSVYGQEYDDYLASRKIVKTAYLSGETKEYDAFVDWLNGQVSVFKGYIEYMSEDQRSNYSSRLYYSDYNSYDYFDGDRDSGYYMTRYANFTIRIPTDFLDSFLAMIGDKCNVTSRNVGSDDITLNYIDVESRVKSLITERDRLQEMLEGAETLDDLIQLESRLSEVRYRMENYESQLRLMDNQVDYSTVNLNIAEVLDFTNLQTLPDNFVGRLWAAFKKGAVNVKDNLVAFVFWFAESFVAIVFWAVVIFIGLKLTKNWRAKRKAEKKAKKEALHGSVLSKERRVLENVVSKGTPGEETEETGGDGDASAE